MNIREKISRKARKGRKGKSYVTLCVQCGSSYQIKSVKIRSIRVHPVE